MKQFAKSLYKFLEAFVSILLASMTVLVFSNVVARYVFGQSFGWSDEASRYLYIWMIFMGALIAYKEHSHLGVDLLVSKLSLKGKKVFYFLNNAIILFVLILFLIGSAQYVILTLDQRSSAMNIPLAYVYVSGLLSILGMALITAGNLFKLFTHKLTEDELVTVSGEDEEKFNEVTNGESAGGDK